MNGRTGSTTHIEERNLRVERRDLVDEVGEGALPLLAGDPEPVEVLGEPEGGDMLAGPPAGEEESSSWVLVVRRAGSGPSAMLPDTPLSLTSVVRAFRLSRPPW